MEEKNEIICERISVIVPIYNTEKYLRYILTNLKPFKRIILLAMLWDLEKGKEVVRMYGELHE